MPKRYPLGGIEIGKPDVKIEIEDFGPITGGKFKLRPLTVLIGPNNAGKSYAAMLVHSIIQSCSSVGSKVYLTGRGFIEQPNRFFGLPGFGMRIRELFEKEYSGLKKDILRLKATEDLILPNSFLSKVAETIYREVFEKKLVFNLNSLFLSPLTQLIREGKKTLSIALSFGNSNIHLKTLHKELKVEDYPDWVLPVRIRNSYSPEGRVQQDGEFLLEADVGYFDLLRRSTVIGKYPPSNRR